MFDKEKERFVIGEDLSFEEYEYLAKLSRNMPSGLNLTRDETLLVRYCYAIFNSTFYMHDAQGKEFYRKPSDETKKAMFDMYVYTLNMQATSGISDELVIPESSIIPALFGGYDQDVIEFALLQQGKRIQCNTEAFENVTAYRIAYDRKYSLVKGAPVSVNDLADSIQKKLADLDEKEIVD